MRPAAWKVILLFAELLAHALCQSSEGRVIGKWHSPRGGCTQAIVEQLDQARESILYQMYNFTSEPVADALIRAHKRGVAVEILLDHVGSTSPSCQAERCAKAGIPVWIDWKHKIAHKKVRVIDGRRVMFGSFNDTPSAEDSNAEDLILDDDTALVAWFADDFQAHKVHAVPFAESRKEDAKRKAAKGRVGPARRRTR